MMKNVYSVGQVNAYIKNMFAQDFMMKHIYVRGEVSNCKYHSSGHIYFTLKDGTGTLGAVMFSSYRKNGLDFRIKEGDTVVVLGAVRVYERDGKYQLYAEEILLEGAGLLYQRFMKLKEELEEMGMFALEYKQPIPKYAKRIGVVTAPTGAAVRDIQSIAARRNPFVQLILYPAQVQGDGATESIINGLHVMEQLQVDVIIVGRGGGSIEDLWAFNEESVARAIFECPIPVISAVGHETDTTIADYVADLRAPTPSAAAELAVFDIRSITDWLVSCQMKLNRQMGSYLDRNRHRYEQYQTKLQLYSPQQRLTEKRQFCADAQERMQYAMERLLTKNRHRLERCVLKLDALSPLKKISDGCGLIADESGKRVDSVTQVHPEDVVQIRLRDGKIRAKVEDVAVIESNEKDGC